MIRAAASAAALALAVSVWAPCVAYSLRSPTPQTAPTLLPQHDAQHQALSPSDAYPLTGLPR